MHQPVDRRAVLAALGVASLAGCLGGGRDGGSGPETPDAVTDGGSKATGGTDGVARGGPPEADETLSLPMDPEAIWEEAVSGGPPKDGIPSIDEPSFVDVEEAAETLDPGDPVFGLAGEDEAKAYPQSILVSHEICNDVVDGRPVAVTYCPLTGTAMGFDRGETTFGVSGRLVNNNLIMYDRARETWWPQVLATAIPGPWNPEPSVRSLREFRVVWTTFARWREAHPDTAILSRDTGFAKNYDRDPYGSYDPPSGLYRPESGTIFRTLIDDERLPPKSVVIGARAPDGAAAFEKDRLREDKLVEGELGGASVLAAYDPKLDTGYVYLNLDGATFEYHDGKVVDADRATHTPASLPLDRVLAFDAMWFAWAGFYPQTTLYAR